MSNLQSIPGVGPSIERDLLTLGYREISDLRDQDPEQMYQQSNELVGLRQDRCLLYVFRCAVYFAETVDLEPELLKWWSWKDRELPR